MAAASAEKHLYESNAVELAAPRGAEKGDRTEMDRAKALWSRAVEHFPVRESVAADDALGDRDVFQLAALPERDEQVVERRRH